MFAALGVVFEDELELQSCSSLNRGTLKYTQEMTLEICSGKTFLPVRGGESACLKLFDAVIMWPLVEEPPYALNTNAIDILFYIH